MEPKDVLGYMKALLNAFAVLDQHNCIHRDIKPANFLYRPANMRENRGAKYMLIDFGMAQTIEDDSKNCSRRSIYYIQLLIRRFLLQLFSERKENTLRLYPSR